MKHKLIARLEDPHLGHDVITISLLSNVLAEKYESPATRFTIAYYKGGPVNLNHMLQHVQAPTRLHIPLGLGGDHTCALIVDIDHNKQSDMLFFNPLGNSKQGHYYQEAQLFINAVDEKFPKKNDYYINKKFQYLAKGDIFCGDWVIWFFEEAAKQSTFSLAELSDYFENIKVTPKPQNLRAEYTKLLDTYLKEEACQEIVDELIQLTSQYQRHLEQNSPKKQQIKSIIDQLINIIISDVDKPSVKIQKFYTFLDAPVLTNESKNSPIKNIDILKKDQSIYYIKAITITLLVIILTLGTAILPGLLIMGLIYITTGKHLGDLFKSEGEVLHEKIHSLKNSYQSSSYGVFFQPLHSLDQNEISISTTVSTSASG